MATDSSRSLFSKQINDICDQVGVSKPDAFPRWICQNILGIADDEKIDEAVSIGGKNDYGIDIFHAEESGDITEQYICWVQAKFSENLDHVARREDIESFASTLGHLMDCPHSANLTFKQKAVEFAKMVKKYPHMRKKMIFAVAGHLNSQAQELLGNSRWREEKLGNELDSNIDLEILDLDKILSRMTIPHTPTVTIKFDGNVIERIDETTGKKSIIGYVGANDLIAIAKDNKEMLFLENPRQTLGKSAPTHKAILNTLSDPDMRKKFWKLNNGITTTCTGYSSTDDQSAYSIENFKVVNGRQTLYTLENSTKPIDDVFLLVSIHETVDAKERNQISEATNTQNPIKPADLVTNYPEMTDLVLQCRENFNDFYFERQTKGFAAATKSTQNRVTKRRVMEKSSVARAYYAYAIDPNEAMMPDKILFSVTSDANYYDRIFKDRDIRELIIPHIFLKMLSELHKKWCRELKDDQSDRISRNKGIISKDIVKYYILRFVHESMLDIDESTRQSVKDRLIEEFRGLEKSDKNPEILEGVAQQAYNAFMTSFDMAMDKTWPPELLEKVNSDKYKKDERDVPSPYEMMDTLKRNGEQLLPHLLRMRKHAISQVGDKVQEELLRLVE